MNESLAEDRLPTLRGDAPEQPTPSAQSFDELPTLGNSSLRAPAEAPVIAGYEILEEIGRGGMGVVYKAQQLRPRRLVALKVLAAGAGSPTDRARFDREADVLARLSCPGVVQVYEAGTYADRDGATRPYVALELVAGTSLDRLLRRGVLKPREAAELLLPLARTMHVVHAAGIVHRDLKPGNVLLASPSLPSPLSHTGERGSNNLPPPSPLVGEGGRGGEGVKVTDFGLAHLLEGEDAALTRVGQVLGTPSYAAPEQVESEHGPIGSAVDVHALGAILYECLTGRPPFKGASLAETLDQVARMEPVPVRRLRPDVPRDLETVCHKCLRKQPAQRYASAAHLADDLERFLNGRAITARPVSPVEHAWRGCRRRPFTSALVVLLAILLAGAVFLAAWLPAYLEALQRRHDAAVAEAEKSRALAVSHEYHWLIQDAGREPVGEPDWPSRILPKIQRAASLDTPLRDAVVLRGHAARCLGATDFVAAPDVPLGFTASQLAAHPKRPVLAVAQAKAWPLVPCLVVLIEASSGKVIRKLSFVPTSMRWIKGRAAQDGVSALAFSPDGRWLVAGTRTGSLVRWDLSRPEPAPTSWTAHKGEVRHVRFDEAALFSVGDDRLLRRWSLCANWESTHQFATRGQPVLTSGDLLVADGDKVHYLNPADLTPRRPAAVADASLLAVPANPEAPAAAARGFSLWAFDVPKGRQGIDFRRKGKKAHYAAIDDLTTSPDGGLIVSASRQTGRVSVWDAASAEVVAELPRGDDVCRVSFDATGQWLAVLNGSELRLTEVRRSTVQIRSAFSSRTVLASCWLGRDELACLAGDRWLGEAEVSVWRDGSLRVRRAVALPESRMPVRLGAAGGRLAWTDDRGVSLAGVNDLSERARVNVRDVQGLAYDGERLWLAFEREAQRWQGETLRPGPSWSNDVGVIVSGLGNLWCVAAGQRKVVVGGRDGSARILDADRAKVAATQPLSAGPITSVALDASETWALLGTADGTLKLLNLDDERVIDVGERHGDRVTAAAFLPGGRAVTASMDGDVRLWDVRGERLSSWLTLSLGSPVVDVSPTEDGQRLAVVLAGERAVRVWHLDRLRAEFARLGLN